MRRVVVLGMWLATGGALGQEAGPPQVPPPNERWTLQFEPSAWFAGPSGKVTLPGSPAGSTKLEDLNLDRPRLAPGGELHLYDGAWTFMLGGYKLTEERGALARAAGQVGPVPFAAGDVLLTTLDFTEVEAAVMRKIELPDSLNGTSGKAFAARLDVLGGVRFYDVSFDFAAPGGNTSADQFFAHPLVGVKLTMDILEQFTVDAQIDLGAFGTGGDSVAYGYDIIAGFMWRPTENFGLQIGYRDLAYLLREGPAGDRFEYQGALQGLIFGGVLRF